MNFAVLQLTLEVPPIESLKRAFRHTTFLVPLDAFTIANDAYGILVKDISREKALNLQGTLQSEGIETEVVEQNALVPLPPAKFTSRMDCTPDGLMIYDPIGRPFEVEWQHVMMITAGNVLLTELKQIAKPTGSLTDDRYDRFASIPTVEYSVKEERNVRFMLEIILTRAILRYSLNVDSPLPFPYLAERATKDSSANASLVLQDMATFAPHLGFNRGAFYFREDAATPFTYPSRNAFFEETTWLLWQMKKTGKL